MLRIAAGKYKRTPLQTPPEEITRPTSTRARQALFNTLLNGGWFSKEEFSQITVLDAFAGSGALGLEALSLGAKKAVFFEQEPKALRCLKQNCSIAEPGSTLIYKTSSLAPPSRPLDVFPPSLIFLDPPYGNDLALKTLLSLQKSDWAKDNPVVVLEVGGKAELEPIEKHFNLKNEEFGFQKQFGAALISIWRPF